MNKSDYVQYTEKMEKTIEVIYNLCLYRFSGRLSIRLLLVLRSIL